MGRQLRMDKSLKLSSIHRMDNKMCSEDLRHVPFSFGYLRSHTCAQGNVLLRESEVSRLYRFSLGVCDPVMLLCISSDIWLAFKFWPTSFRLEICTLPEAKHHPTVTPEKINFHVNGNTAALNTSGVCSLLALEGKK